MPIITVEKDVNLYYEDFGYGPPVVLVHGGAANHKMWEHQVGALAGDFRTITYDARGNSGSDKPRSGYTLGRLAADLAALVGRLGLQSTAIVAHGMGVHVALAAVGKYPSICSQLVLVSGAPWYKGERDGIAGGFGEDFYMWLRNGSGKNNAQLNYDLIEKYYFHRDPGFATKLACLNMALEWPLFVAQELYKDLEEVDHRSILPQITAPTLIMHGRHNLKNRFEGAVYLKEQIVDAEFVVFEESAESPQIEEMDKFNTVLDQFLRSRG